MTGDPEDISPPVRSTHAVEFLRVVQQHHIQLSSMADVKANVLLGASLLIFSTSLKEARDSHVTIPLFLLMATSFAVAGLIILAMIPETSARRHPSPNLLFFGVFSKMSEEEFQTRMVELLGDEEKLHQAMIRDIYQIGHVLHVKKYRRLGQAYQVFFYGLMPSGAAVLGGAAWKMFHA